MLKDLTISSAGDPVYLLEFSSIVDGNANGRAASENSLAVLYKIKHKLVIRFSKFTTWYFIKRNRNISLRENMYVNVCSGSIYSSQKSTQLFIFWSVDKQTVVYLYNRILPCYKKGKNCFTRISNEFLFMCFQFYS